MLKASTALASGDTVTALSIVAEHARAFPARHAAGREQMRVQALLRSGRSAPAP